MANIMVRKYLSFNFKQLFFKQLMIFISIIINIAVFTFSIAYLFFGVQHKVETVIITQLYFFHSIIFDYILIKSKDVLYDETKLFIKNGKGSFIELPFDQIVKIKRVFFYFYKVTFKNNINQEDKIYYYISPYPTFSRQKELIEISRYAKSNW